MKPEPRPATAADTDLARRAAWTAFCDRLQRRVGGASGKTPRPERMESVVRQVDGGEAPGVSDSEDLTTRFGRAASAVGVCVHSATAACWVDVIIDVLQNAAVGSVVLPPVGDGFFDRARLDSLTRRLSDAGVATVAGPDDESLFSAGAAITGVAAAIAETGSIVCESSATVMRGASLVPPTHVAVLAASQVLPDLYDFFDGLAKRPELPAGVSVITGPSKTADIEGVLVTGVHGPGVMQAVVVGDA